MADENINNNQSQEDLAKAWEEALAEQQKQSQESSPQLTDTSGQSEEDIMKMWQEAMGTSPSGESSSPAEPASFANEPQGGPSELPPDWEILADIPLELSVEIGDTEMPIGDIIKLQPTSIIELRRRVNEPVDIKINGQLIAKAELYVNEDKWAIKIIQIISPEERLRIAREIHEE